MISFRYTKTFLIVYTKLLESNFENKENKTDSLFIDHIHTHTQLESSDIWKLYTSHGTNYIYMKHFIYWKHFITHENVLWSYDYVLLISVILCEVPFRTQGIYISYITQHKRVTMSFLEVINKRKLCFYFINLTLYMGLCVL